MKRLLNFFIIPTIAILIATGCNRTPKNGIHSITVCSTTDLHGAYFDSYYNEEARLASLANVSTYVKQLRIKGIKPVLIDVGDNLQGDNAAYYCNYIDTVGVHIFARAAEYIGYDAIVVGNHDIEAGHQVYDRFKEGKIPYLAANAIIEGSEGEPYFEPYTIITRKGIKIAVIGMTNANIKSWISQELWEGIDFLKISDVAQDWVDLVIEKESPHLVILACHTGSGHGGPDIENEARYLASSIRGVDMVLAGHDHRAIAETIDNPDGEVLLINAGDRASLLGEATFELEFKDGEVISKNFVSRLVPMSDVNPDPRYTARFKKDFKVVYEFANREIGTITEEIYFADALVGPSSYINLVHQVQLDVSGADISITAPLSSSGLIPAGVIRYQDLVLLYKYENSLFVVELTGAQIKNYLELSYYNWVNNIGPAYNFDSADGIVYRVKKSEPRGSMVEIISMRDGTPFDYDRIYKVAISSYRASGGGNLLRDGAGVNPDSLQVISRYGDIRTLIGEYIAKEGIIVPETPANWSFVK
ncbi:MAG: bifunctional metallophosphatase/5'-nucleotidase [Bacteroidales bacterium]|jgi:2',3'-cyclic-nucleotide 2'-phosphodiesterase/3'-nucleotidase|nr:bifunctional metallophosphatase/5'-nucleotidase [Bacteroidales bacterium]